MNHARAFEEKNFVSADSDDIDLDSVALDTDTDKADALRQGSRSSLLIY